MRETATSLRRLSLAAIAVLATLAGSGRALAQEVEHEQGAANHKRHSRPLVIASQGSFMFGGTVITGSDGNTFHGDHGYVQFQIPPHAREFPMVMWHGGGQFSKTWETTPDGRAGYQTIFLRRGWPVYIIDQPRRGRAGKTTIGTTIPDAVPDEANLFNVFRLGTWTPPGTPAYFPDVAFPRDSASLAQYFRQVTPNTGPGAWEGADPEVTSDAVSALFDSIGPGVLLTHSASGGPGWLTATKNAKIRAIVAYEPVRFLFPEGELPPPQGIFEQVPVPLSEFRKLTEIPIQLVYGDHLQDVPLWVAAFANAQAFVAAVNRHGGDATILHLPDVGLHGNTHFPFSDLNNREVAKLLSQYLHEKGLDRRGGHGEDEDKDVATH
jgi:hypothetical protein